MIAPYVAIEGPDGCGKTTVTKQLAVHYAESGLTVLQTREPGASPLGKHLRELLLSTDLELDPTTELFLQLADRAASLQHLREQHAATDLILTDRCFLSTYVYQYENRLPEDRAVRRSDELEVLLDTATGGDYPDLVLYLRVPTDERCARLLSRGLDPDRYSDLDARALGEAYERAFTKHVPVSRRAVLDLTGEESPGQVTALAVRLINGHLPTLGGRPATRLLGVGRTLPA